MLAQRRSRVALDPVLVLGHGRCERVMDERPLPRVLVVQEEREVEDPEERLLRVVDQAEL